MLNFPSSRWEQITKACSEFWNRKLNRPLLNVMRGVSADDDKRGAAPDTPSLSQATCHMDIPAQKWLDRFEYDLEGVRFFGDAFPMFNLESFGPGVAAAFMGARLDTSTGRVWFHPQKNVPINELTFTYDPNNVWFLKVKELMAEATRRWQGEILVGMPDFGGVLDILSTFLPGEQLLTDLYDAPEEVIRCCNEIQALWFRYYDELAEVIAPTQGYGSWAGVLMPRGGYMFQCDFAYMISPDMFRTFALDTLKRDFARSNGSAYHLDGIGQLPHLDMLLAMDDLQMVQWIPGAGSAPECAWPAVHKKILQAGKHIQLLASPIDALRPYLGTLRDSLGAAHNAQMRVWTNESDVEIQRFIDETYRLYEG